MIVQKIKEINIYLKSIILALLLVTIGIFLMTPYGLIISLSGLVLWNFKGLVKDISGCIKGDYFKEV